MALDLYPKNITKFDPLINVNYRQRMTPEVEQRLANNIAFQGYMWVPCLSVNSEVISSVAEYIYYQIKVPAVDIDICVKRTEASTPITYSRYRLYNNGVQIGDSDYNDTIPEEFTEEFTEDLDYIAHITRSDNSGTIMLKIWALYDPNIQPFTVFYRIRE